MIHERWVHVGRDADGEVYVSADVDLEGMREVRFGDGRRQRFRPDGPIPWLETLTHWTVAPSEVTYVTEDGEPAAPPWPPSPWRFLGPVEGARSAHLILGDGQAYIAPAGTPAPAYPRRAIQWFGSEGTVTMSHDFSEPPPGLDDD